MKNNMTVERTLGAPRSQVWAVLADYGNIVDWNSGIKASRVTGDAPDGVGAEGLQRLRRRPRNRLEGSFGLT